MKIVTRTRSRLSQEEQMDKEDQNGIMIRNVLESHRRLSCNFTSGSFDGSLLNDLFYLVSFS